MDGVVAPQTCHAQAGESPRGLRGLHCQPYPISRSPGFGLLVDLDGKGPYFRDPKGSTPGFMQCGGSSWAREGG